ncbi:MAG: hypothetical protein WA130_14850 [Candidatus Methanoperedens sp.]
MKRKVTLRMTGILGSGLFLEIWIYRLRTRKYWDTRNKMVKHKKIIILTILFILLSGCVSNKTTYAGTYYKDPSNYITLNPDGTFIVTQDPMEGGGFTGTFEVNTDNGQKDKYQKRASAATSAFS